MIRILTFVLVLLSAGIAHAADAMPEFKQPSLNYKTMQSGTYRLDPSHTNVIFKISHLGFSQYIGRFNDIKGTLSFDANNITNSDLSVSIDPDSVDVNHRVLEGELKGEKYFNTSSFPDITFEATSVKQTGPTTGIITGDLNFHGVTKPIQLQAKFNGGGKFPFTGTPVLGFAATTTIKRSDFGMTEGIPLVGDEVAIEIQTEFHYEDAKTMN
ncbi:MAG: polyisoprenoid-binding protein [Alphaproteobacteria bacterium]|nr:MAG: polyisoprenoid-binding protein [Alphaproteobacteria bacterium]